MNKLTDTLKDYQTIAVVGMCKNAGKTTVVNHIIDVFKDEYQIGLTSIGYDGEKQDEITKLEKPRIEVYPGMIIATCDCALNTASAGYKKVRDTGIRTALGEVSIIRIKTQGLVEVSGPSMVSQIEALSYEMKKLGCSKIIVDGSAGRTSFASRLDCTVLSVGAALSNDMNKVVKLAEHQVDMFDLNLCEKSYAVSFSGKKPYAVLKNENDVQIIFRGAMVNDDLIEIMKKYKDSKKVAIVNDASSVFIAPRIYKKFLHKNGEICVLNKTNLIAVTINPMSPYAKWFDKDKFYEEMQEHVDLPVFNVMDEKV